MFESDVQWVCTCPDPTDRPCDVCHERISCEECVYAMDPVDLPE